MALVCHKRVLRATSALRARCRELEQRLAEAPRTTGKEGAAGGPDASAETQAASRDPTAPSSGDVQFPCQRCSLGTTPTATHDAPAPDPALVAVSAAAWCAAAAALAPASRAALAWCQAHVTQKGAASSASFGALHGLWEALERSPAEALLEGLEDCVAGDATWRAAPGLVGALEDLFRAGAQPPHAGGHAGGDADNAGRGGDCREPARADGALGWCGEGGKPSETVDWRDEGGPSEAAGWGPRGEDEWGETFPSGWGGGDGYRERGSGRAPSDAPGREAPSGGDPYAGELNARGDGGGGYPHPLVVSDQGQSQPSVEAGFPLLPPPPGVAPSPPLSPSDWDCLGLFARSLAAMADDRVSLDDVAKTKARERAGTDDREGGQEVSQAPSLREPIEASLASFPPPPCCTSASQRASWLLEAFLARPTLALAGAASVAGELADAVAELARRVHSGAEEGGLGGDGGLEEERAACDLAPKTSRASPVAHLDSASPPPNAPPPGPVAPPAPLRLLSEATLERRAASLASLLETALAQLVPQNESGLVMFPRVQGGVARALGGGVRESAARCELIALAHPRVARAIQRVWTRVQGKLTYV